MKLTLLNSGSPSRSMTQLISILVIILLSQNVYAEKVGLFYNSTYIQISEGNLFAEGSNLLRSLEGAGHTVTTFEGLDAASWEQMILENDVLIIPELERQNLYTDLPSTTIALLNNYVLNGGGLIICGVVAPNVANSNNAIELLNGIYDFNLEATEIALSGASNKIDTQANNTNYTTCLASIANNNSISFLTAGLPTGTKRIYQDATNEDNTTVAILPYHTGKIAYLGWGWWNAAPLGSQDNGWLAVLEASIKEVACTAPVVSAINAFTLELNDTNTTLEAALLNDASYSCAAATFTVTPNTFTCDQIGTQTAVFTITDAIGRSESTTVTIDVTDPNAVCALVASTATISGKISTFAGEHIEGVTMELFGGLNNATLTGVNGTFSFDAMDTNMAYEVMPTKNDNPLNGVSAYDLVLMSRHVLDIEKLDNPYKIIAADVNNSGTVTTADIVELRNLILYRQETFSNNDAWRFVNSNYVFENSANPLAESFPSVSFIQTLVADAAINFIGIKIGDVDGSAIPNAAAGDQDRNEQKDLFLTVEQQDNKATIVLEETTDLMGMQFTLNFDAATVADLAITSTAFAPTAFDTNIDMTAGLIHLTCHQNIATTYKAGAALFTIDYTTTSATTALFTLNERYMTPEAYTGMNEMATLRLQTQTVESTTTTAATSLEVAQNQPNPFDTYTTIAFEMESAANITLVVHNMAGQQVYAFSGAYAAGMNTIQLNANDLAGNGVFVYTLQTPNASISMRMVKI